VDGIDLGAAKKPALNGKLKAVPFVNLKRLDA
jgi:hypothetical protein